jgi:hypothetical protein
MPLCSCSRHSGYAVILNLKTHQIMCSTSMNWQYQNVSQKSLIPQSFSPAKVHVFLRFYTMYYTKTRYKAAPLSLPHCTAAHPPYYSYYWLGNQNVQPWSRLHTRTVHTVGYRVGVWGGNPPPPPIPEISKFLQSWTEFPVPWKIHP